MRDNRRSGGWGGRLLVALVILVFVVAVGIAIYAGIERQGRNALGPTSLEPPR